MYKYLAVIHDSFREAFASRVLWLMLLMISFLLLVVMPLGYREELTWRLRDKDVREWPDLMKKVRDSADDRKLSTAKRIWDLLDEEMQDRLEDVRIPGVDKDVANPFEFISFFGDFKVEVNKLLERSDLYDPEYFSDVRLLSAELRELRDKGLDQLSSAEIARFNRLLLEAALPDLIRGSPPTSIQFVYAWADFGVAYPLRGETFREWLQSSVSTAMNWFVGALGICVAILVTAPIIPQLFDPGSLHLLMSKPISRWLLFLAKYLGGCAFILVGATYLIGGLWFVLGVRFGVWQPTLLVSIPIYLFVFAIYYSVSALVGVIWRSPIVCIALTVTFWLVCFLVGFFKVGLETTFWNKERITGVIAADDSIFAVKETGIVHEWDEADGQWNEIFVTPDQRQVRGIMVFMPTISRELLPVGPVYDARRDMLVSVQPTFPPTSRKLYAAERSDEWDPVTNSSAPMGTLGLFREPAGSILAVSSLGVFRLRDDPLVAKEPVKLPFGVTIPTNFGGSFRKVSPDPPVFATQPATAAYWGETGTLAIYTRGTITMLAAEEGGAFRRLQKHKLDGGERQPVVMALADSNLVVAREDGRVQVFDCRTFELLKEEKPEGPNQPRFVTAAPQGGQFAIVFHNGNLWLYDAASNTIRLAPVAGQGDISAAEFADNGNLVVADRATRVSRYEMPSTGLVQRYSPKLGLLGIIYRYGLLPLYTVFPKPGEMDKTIQYLLSGKETERSDRDDLATAQQEIDPWTPVWSSALFLVVMLTCACVYIERQDF